HFSNDAGKAHLHLSDKQENTAFALTERYHKTIPLFNIGYNADDGLILGAGIRLIRQGFRKSPYASTHQFNLSHAFLTKAFRSRISSEWLKVAGGADLLFNANIFAPDNTQNFFGRGNETVFNKVGNFRRYYRSVFTILQADPALRWRSGLKNSFTIGPSVQYYHYDIEDNKNRFISNTGLINTYDSATIANDKTHLGIVVNYIHDSRNHLLLPNAGSLFSLKIKGYDGLNKYSRSYAQVTSELALFKPIGRNANFVIADRIGGGVSVGKTAFYQSLFLGGHDNLLGFRQYRFAGQHMLYNNVEARLKVANIASYIVPGQLGILGFYDVGRVWENKDRSNKWHQGYGAGIYFAPAQLLLLQLVAGKSVEGWYPYFTMGFRF
ncbi:MAG: BamA/TamA family outer membrane protein, partial [Ferruginibacter sp.]